MTTPEIIAILCTLMGSLFTSLIAGLYWLLKCRKDIDAAHQMIRQMRKKK